MESIGNGRHPCLAAAAQGIWHLCETNKEERRYRIRKRGIKMRLLFIIGYVSRNNASSVGALPAPTDNPRLLCRKIGDADVQAASPAEKKTRLVNTCLLYVR